MAANREEFRSLKKHINRKTLSRVEAANYVGDVIESYAINGYDRYEARDKANSKLIGMCGFLLGKNGYTFWV